MRVTHTRPMLREALLALLVLGLVFLNFGHSMPAYASGQVVVSGASFCGDPLHAPGDGGDHSVCHACRIGGGADMPAVITAAEPIVFTVAAVVFTEAGDASGRDILVELRNARAPPSI